VNGEGRVAERDMIRAIHQSGADLLLVPAPIVVREAGDVDTTSELLDLALLHKLLPLPGGEPEAQGLSPREGTNAECAGEVHLVISAGSEAL
jgi:hypothetical protein